MYKINIAKGYTGTFFVCYAVFRKKALTKECKGYIIREHSREGTTTEKGVKKLFEKRFKKVVDKLGRCGIINELSRKG